jgi:hypothetical protein
MILPQLRFRACWNLDCIYSDCRVRVSMPVGLRCFQPNCCVRPLAPLPRARVKWNIWNENVKTKSANGGGEHATIVRALPALVRIQGRSQCMQNAENRFQTLDGNKDSNVDIQGSTGVRPVTQCKGTAHGIWDPVRIELIDERSRYGGDSRVWFHGCVNGAG